MAAAAAAVVLLTTGCSTADRGTADLEAPTTTVAGELSVPEYYDTVDDLMANSSLVVQVVPSDEVTEESVGSSAFAVTTVTVDDVVNADGVPVATGDEIRIRYSGRRTELYEGMPGPLVAGDTYVVFLEPFTFGDGRDTGQWVVVPPGQWRQDDREGPFELDVVGSPGSMSELPRELDPALIADR